MEGDLISLALQGEFDVVAHGCNCFCRMKRGIAPLMAEAFACHIFPLEGKGFAGDFNKLGQIDVFGFILKDTERLIPKWDEKPNFWVANMYTQYHWEEPSVYGVPLDYDALRMCLRKLNHRFKGKKIGIPWIGCGLAGGDKEIVRTFIESDLQNCNVTIVELKP